MSIPRHGVSELIGGIKMAKEFARGFYSSKTWQECREDYAKAKHYLCENCLARGIYRPGVIVHHIEEVTPMNIDNPEVTLNHDNLRLVCRDCHAQEHKAHAKDRRYVICEDGGVRLRELVR